MRPLRNAGFAALALALSCTQIPGPRRLSGAYRFVCVNECTLPYFSSRTAQCQTYVTGADLVLRPDATFAVTWRDSTTCQPPEPVGARVTPRVYTGRYTMTGLAMTFDFAGGNGVLAAAYERDTIAWGHTASMAAGGFPIKYAFVRAR